MTIAALKEEPLVSTEKTYKDVTEDVCKPLESFPTKKWWVCFVISALVAVSVVIEAYIAYQ